MKKIYFLTLILSCFSINADSIVGDTIIAGGKVYKCSGGKKEITFWGKVLCDGKRIEPEVVSDKVMELENTNGCSITISNGDTGTCDGQPYKIVRKSSNKAAKISKQCVLLQTSFIGCSDLKKSSSPWTKCCNDDTYDSRLSKHNSSTRFIKVFNDFVDDVHTITLPPLATGR